eukprot:TRINITY_DN17792_c0_g1_i2.p1 TRINITY_DN17792_c0_g1~~TRINITY_DN17792_c0_g1_i2.p1  ORF type:complete len:1027 (-),score=223.25 TRINITY_DN17792_c0_g1_i2:56-3136(-)
MLGSDQGNTFCSPCPQGYYTGLPGQVVCKKCPKGKYSDQMNATTCLACQAGTFSSVDSSITCASCEGGKFAAGLSNVMCTGCDLGKYSLGGASSCTECPSGKSQILGGKTSCNNCSAGYANQFTGQANCFQCYKGYISPIDGMINCVSCPAGTYSDAMFTSCLPCTSGQYSLEAKSSCSSCELGRYSNASSVSACNLCPLGMFSDMESSIVCENCPIGKYSNSFGAYQCQDCDLGTKVNYSGSASCEACAAGSYQSNYGQTSCQPCPPGSSAPLPRASQCTYCDRGTYSNAFNTVQCSSCSNGTYQPDSNSTYCLTCAVGTYANAPKSSSCLLCPVGRYTASTGTSSCTSCAAGQYQDLEGKTFCQICGVGKYSAGGVQYCDTCPDRTIANFTGAASCVACPQMSVASDDRTDCLCNVGYFANHTSDEPSGKKCIKCSTGAYCKSQGVTWESLTSSSGYWRSSTDSNSFYSCQFLSDCVGGRYSNCSDHRTGPICALCDTGYVLFGNTCRACGSQTATWATFIALVIVICCVVIAMYYIVLKFDKRQLRKFKKTMEMQEFMGDEHMDDFYQYDDENFEASSGDGTPQRPPNFAYKLKIMLGFFQISVGMAYSVNIEWPSLFKEFIAMFNIANFDIVQWTRVGCIIKSNYLNKHLIVSLAPLILGTAVATGYLAPKYFSYLRAYISGDDSALTKTSLRLKRGVRKFWKMFLFTLFLLYPSVSSIVVRLYSCRTIEGVSYLVADFSILCSSSEWFNRALLNVFFVVIYPIGILALFSWILFENRHKLNEFDSLIQFGFLYGDFNHDVWWFELVDMSHKLFMTSALALFPDNSVYIVALTVLGLHFIGLLWMNPYVRKGDDRLHLLCQGVLFLYVLGGYVYSMATEYDPTTDASLSVLFIAMVVGLVAYVISQVVSVARKLYKIRQNRVKKQAGAAAAVEVNVLAEYMLKEVRRDDAHYRRNPLYESNFKNVVMAEDIAPEPHAPKPNMAFVDAPAPDAPEPKQKIRVQFAPTRSKAMTDESGQDLKVD